MGELGMNVVVLDNVPYELSTDTILAKLHLQKDSSYFEGVAKLIAEASAIGRPKAIYKPVCIEVKGADFVIVDGIRLTSRVLRVNLEAVDQVFPYVITCGRELDEWSRRFKDRFDNYCTDLIKEIVLVCAREYVMSQLERQYGLEQPARMSPGSLEDWPLTEQIPLFQLLGDVKESIGVELTGACLMYPIKSVSGIYFAHGESFESCRLCLREKCPNRRANYDKGLYEQKYKLT
jgi:hypothetical protein